MTSQEGTSVRSNDKPKPARMTSVEERAPLYAAYAASRHRGEDIGYRCPDDSIIQYAVRAYDREKYGTEELMLPNWLVDLIEAAMCNQGELDHDEQAHQTGKCERCYWDALLEGIPERTMTLVKQAVQLWLTDSRPNATEGDHEHDGHCLKAGGVCSPEAQGWAEGGDAR